MNRDAPSPPSLSPAGERDGGEGDAAFMASIRVQILEVSPLHEPASGERTAVSTRINWRRLADKAVRARALGKERAPEGGSPSLAELPAKG